MGSDTIQGRYMLIQHDSVKCDALQYDLYLFIDIYIIKDQGFPSYFMAQEQKIDVKKYPSFQNYIEFITFPTNTVLTTKNLR